MLLVLVVVLVPVLPEREREREREREIHFATQLSFSCALKTSITMAYLQLILNRIERRHCETMLVIHLFLNIDISKESNLF